MKIKEWEKYTKEEKKEILNHWWYYYGKLLLSLDEIEKFNKLLDSNTDDIFVTALCGYAQGLSSQVLIGAMRQGKVDELFGILPDFKNDEKLKEAFKTISADFLNEVVGTLNNPEPDIPMSEEEIIKQLK